jgi:hypothetical protein
MKIFVEKLRAFKEKMTVCQVVTEECLEKSKAGLDKMETTDLEANPEAAEIVVERQELRNEEAVEDTTDIGGPTSLWKLSSLQEKKRTQGISVFSKNLASVRRWKIHRAVLHWARDMFLRGQAGSVLQKLVKRRQTDQECSSGIWDRYL